MRPADESVNHSGRAGLAAHRLHDPFEPHRLTLDEMEYTTMSRSMNKLGSCGAKVE
jgi:fructose 1,6-bisphosphatase